MTNPSDADPVIFRWSQDGFKDVAGYLAKHPGHDAVSEKLRVAPGPAPLRS